MSWVSRGRAACGVLVNGVTVMVAAWAQEEMDSVQLGDERLDARIATLLSDLGNRPNLSIPGACRGRAEMQAAYRFFANDKVSFQNVLSPHSAELVKGVIHNYLFIGPCPVLRIRRKCGMNHRQDRNESA
jgi:hypothetical protein